jgi:hypothetical protein
MSEMPETLRNLGYHLRVMADKASEQIDADRLSRAADEVERADLPPTLSAAMELPEVRALVEAARKMLVAAELREIYHRLPNDKNRIGDPKSPKAKARDAWLKAFRRASSATSLALAAIKEPKT